MKYTIEGFDQRKLVEYKLDVIDALILRWFVDFAATGQMKSIKENDNIYYLVKFNAIIDEFPIFGINSVKAISTRFDKYIAAGLFLKKVITGGSFHGKTIFFAPTEKVLEIIYSKDCINTNKNCIYENTEENSEENQTSFRENKELFDQNNVNKTLQNQTKEPVFTCFLQKKDNNNLHNHNSNKQENSEENQTSFRENEEKFNSARKEVEFPPKRSELPFGLKNSSSINSSSINSSSKFSEEDIKKILSSRLDLALFTKDFIPQLFLKLNNLTFVDCQDYLISEIQSVFSNKKIPESKQYAYLYKTLGSDLSLQNFLNNKNKNKTSAGITEITCPVCGKLHSTYDDCPLCNLRNPNNEEEILFRKNIYELPAEVKTELESELRDLSAKYNLIFKNHSELNEFRTEKIKIYQKYYHELTSEQFGKIFC